jgi:hypothetical protein
VAVDLEKLGKFVTEQWGDYPDEDMTEALLWIQDLAAEVKKLREFHRQVKEDGVWTYVV